MRLVAPAVSTAKASAAVGGRRAPAIDHMGYPHLIDAIFHGAPYESLLALRSASRGFRDRVDRALVDTIILTPDEVAMGTAGRGRIPRSRWWDNPDIVSNVCVATIHPSGTRDSELGQADAPLQTDPAVAATSTTASNSTLCLRAICHPWADPVALAKLDPDCIAVCVIQQEGKRTVIVFLRHLDKFLPSGNFLQRGIDKLVVNFPVEDDAFRTDATPCHYSEKHLEFGFTPQNILVQEVVIIYPQRAVEERNNASQAVRKVGDMMAGWDARQDQGTRSCVPTIIGAEEYDAIFNGWPTAHIKIWMAFCQKAERGERG